MPRIEGKQIQGSAGRFCRNTVSFLGGKLLGQNWPFHALPNPRIMQTRIFSQITVRVMTEWESDYTPQFKLRIHLNCQNVLVL